MVYYICNGILCILYVIPVYYRVIIMYSIMYLYITIIRIIYICTIRII